MLLVWLYMSTGSTSQFPIFQPSARASLKAIINTAKSMSLECFANSESTRDIMVSVLYRLVENYAGGFVTRIR